MRTWQIGDITVTSVIEVDGPAPGKFLFSEATPDVLAERHGWARGTFIDDDGMLLTRVQALVVQAGGKTVVVDTCIGNDKQRDIPAWNNLQLPFMDRFREAGFDPLTVDAVVCTHLHVDHVGWNTSLVDGEWKPTFPESRYCHRRPRVPALGRAEQPHGRVPRLRRAGGEGRARRPRRRRRRDRARA